MKVLEKIAKRTVDGWLANGMTSDEAHTKLLKMKSMVAEDGNDAILVGLMIDYENELFLSDL